MGNPAGVKRKKREKRRAKFEQRLGGPLAYVPKDVREQVLKEVKQTAPKKVSPKKAEAKPNAK
jgi:hypothetical protein